MKQLYRVLPIVLSVGLFGCSNPNNATTQDSANTNSPVVTENKDAFVSKLPDSAPVVKVGTEANYAPYEFKDEYGNVTGFDIELMQYIGENQGFKIEVYNDPWEGLFNNLDNKSRDMVAAGLTYSNERASKYLLSNAYAPLPTSLVYLDKSLNIQSLNDLSNVRLGVLSNSEPYEYFVQGNYKTKAIEQYPTTFAAVEAMVQDKVDAVVDDSGVLRYTLNDLPSLQPQYFDYESIRADGAHKVFLIDKSQPDLLKKVNIGLKGLKEDGTYARLTTKWFGTDLTKISLQQEEMLQQTQVQ
ncbi:transporter substrate-binding domain-containing protein [Psychrobacter sp. S1-30-MNA-CIBAN-0213]|uniref:substrate-binding periplasmic protein n=1 Tax=unclassified Psychrobacter TaxID=196806 RepID=UPI00332733F8